MLNAMKKTMVASAVAALAAMAGAPGASASVTDVSTFGVNCGVLGSNPSCTTTVTAAGAVEMWAGDPDNVGSARVQSCDSSFRMEVDGTGTARIFDVEFRPGDVGCDWVVACPDDETGDPIPWSGELSVGATVVRQAIDVCFNSMLGGKAGSLDLDTNVTSGGGGQTLWSFTTGPGGRQIGTTWGYLVGTWTVDGGLTVTP